MLPDAAYIDLIVASLKQGAVFVLKGDMPFDSVTPHFFVVLNYNPDTDEYLIAVNNTSKVVSRLTTLSRQKGVNVNETTIVFSPGEYSFFPDQTLFDCNTLHEISKGELLEAYKKGNFWIASDEVELKTTDLQRLYQATLKSKNVSPINKKLIDPDYERP